MRFPQREGHQIWAGQELCANCQEDIQSSEAAVKFWLRSRYHVVLGHTLLAGELTGAHFEVLETIWA